MPASKALETLLVCTCLAQCSLSSGINDDFVGDKVVKKFFTQVSLLVRSTSSQQLLRGLDVKFTMNTIALDMVDDQMGSALLPTTYSD